MYTMRTVVNGKYVSTEQVSEKFVENYTCLRARQFFINLGGQESMRRGKDGTITVRSIDPTGATIKSVTFKPLADTPCEHRRTYVEAPDTDPTTEYVICYDCGENRPRR